MPDSIKEIDTRLIDLEDDRYSTQYDSSVPVSDFSDLKASIQQSGIINPPVITSEKDGFVVVAGRKRLLAAIELGLDKVLCRITDMAPLDAYLLAITDNAYSGSYSELDKAMIVSKLHCFSEYESSDSMMHRLAKIKGMRMNREYLDRLFRLNRLSDDLKKALSDGVVSPSVVLEYDFFINGDAEAVLGFLRLLRLGLNLQREFCNLIFEISKIKECAISEILGSLPEDIMVGAGADVARQREAIMSFLRKMRYPNLEMAKENFAATVRKLVKKDSQVSFLPPRNPDSSEVTVSFSFKTVEGFLSGSGELAQIAKNDKLADILMFSPKS